MEALARAVRQFGISSAKGRNLMRATPIGGEHSASCVGRLHCVGNSNKKFFKLLIFLISDERCFIEKYCISFGGLTDKLIARELVFPDDALIESLR